MYCDDGWREPTSFQYACCRGSSHLDHNLRTSSWPPPLESGQVPDTSQVSPQCHLQAPSWDMAGELPYEAKLLAGRESSTPKHATLAPRAFPSFLTLLRRWSVTQRRLCPGDREERGSQDLHENHYWASTVSLT